MASDDRRSEAPQEVEELRRRVNEEFLCGCAMPMPGSSQVWRERDRYYDYLEDTQKGDLDITLHLDWFLGCFDRALGSAETILAGVLKKAHFWERHSAVSLNDRQRAMLNRLVDGFEGKLTSSKWAKITKCSPDTALRDINALIKQSILVKDDAGGRSTGYLLKEFE